MLDKIEILGAPVDGPELVGFICMTQWLDDALVRTGPLLSAGNPMGSSVFDLRYK